MVAGESERRALWCYVRGRCRRDAVPCVCVCVCVGTYIFVRRHRSLRAVVDFFSVFLFPCSSPSPRYHCPSRLNVTVYSCTELLTQFRGRRRRRTGQSISLACDTRPNSVKPMCVVARAPTVYCMWTTHVLKVTIPLGSKYYNFFFSFFCYILSTAYGMIWILICILLLISITLYILSAFE